MSTSSTPFTLPSHHFKPLVPKVDASHFRPMPVMSKPATEDKNTRPPSINPPKPSKKSQQPVTILPKPKETRTISPENQNLLEIPNSAVFAHSTNQDKPKSPENEDVFEDVDDDDLIPDFDANEESNLGLPSSSMPLLLTPIKMTPTTEERYNKGVKRSPDEAKLDERQYQAIKPKQLLLKPKNEQKNANQALNSESQQEPQNQQKHAQQQNQQLTQNYQQLTQNPQQLAQESEKQVSKEQQQPEQLLIQMPQQLIEQITEPQQLIHQLQQASQQLPQASQQLLQLQPMSQGPQQAKSVQPILPKPLSEAKSARKGRQQKEAELTLQLLEAEKPDDESLRKQHEALESEKQVSKEQQQPEQLLIQMPQQLIEQITEPQQLIHQLQQASQQLPQASQQLLQLQPMSQGPQQAKSVQPILPKPLSEAKSARKGRQQKEAELTLQLLEAEKPDDESLRKQHEALEISMTAQEQLSAEMFSQFCIIVINDSLSNKRKFTELHTLCTGKMELQEMLLDLLSPGEALELGAELYHQFAIRDATKRFFRKVKIAFSTQPSVLTKILKDFQTILGNPELKQEEVVALGQRYFKSNQMLLDEFMTFVDNVPYPEHLLPEPEIVDLRYDIEK